MSEPTEEPAMKAEAPSTEKVPLGEPGEHPLSVLLFSWMRSKFFFRVAMALLAAFGAVLVALEIALSGKAVTSLANMPGFFGIVGFAGFGIAVLSGWPLGRLMRRPEDYYDTRSGEAGRDR
ncbi:MAG TPA: hypothetical protein PLN33_17280 [Hyphomonadaceae bacterium]|jgi:hypothetical protein|nr:hypothetical protein [Hyphomonadaceae bacterium]HPN05438.1 hypothetical protein [Hyphomonadaceae bacterium]